MDRIHTVGTPLSPLPKSSSPQSLAPYSGAWNRTTARHLVARTHFGALKRDVDRAYNDGSVGAAVDRIVNSALGVPLPEPPSWYGSNSSTGVNEIYDLQIGWLNAMRSEGLVEKMTLFWHNHMPTQWSINQNKTSLSIGHLCHDHYKLLRLNALGNFRELIRDIGLNASMLLYLDGYLNEAGAANENYARELLELFTMGQYAPDGSENYSENDIKEIARALTGWVVASNRTASFDPQRHDSGTKSFLGQTGTFGYHDVVDVVFAQRASEIAHFLGRKLYTFFVHAVPDEAVVSAIASELIAADFEIVPVLRKLFKSAHFYRSTVIGARIKSPVEFLLGFIREAEVVVTTTLWDRVRDALAAINLGEELLNPPNVAGWPGFNPPDASGNPGHHTWLTTSTLPDRWKLLGDVIYEREGASYDPFELVSKISDPSDPFRIAVDLASAFVPIPLAETGIREIEEPFAGDPDLLPSEVKNAPPHEQNLAKILLDGTPFNEWPSSPDGTSQRTVAARQLLRAYLTYLVQLPAYQLT
ncbi:MAG: DUF1800 domain-containing protein [Rhodothermia bacterium]|nr:DUF1800 domain-containing protein [Rhodothermia bacterium]